MGEKPGDAGGNGSVGTRGDEANGARGDESNGARDDDAGDSRDDDAVDSRDDDAGDSHGTPEGYVHRPEGEPAPPPEDREFGWQGWLLVGAVLVAFFLVPALIYLNAREVVAIPFQFAFLVLPLVPAVLLALLAVWVTTTR